MSPWPAPSLRHVARLTDEIGVTEHARFEQPRPELGYCTDDAGRALALVSRLPSDPDAHRIATASLGFLARANTGAASFRLRCDAHGRWTGDGPSDDASGRALLGLGTAAARAPWPDVRAEALELFDQADGFRSPYPRARAYAALGAIEVLASYPRHAGAARLCTSAVDLLSGCPDDPAWPWPEPRLTYANALIPDGALAVAVATGRDRDVAKALVLLEWLVAEESRGGRFSFTPVGGRGPGERRPAFDQQPIEAWSMADACARAYSVTGEPRWTRWIERAGRWFLGDNDIGVPVFDPISGGGFDGLEPDGVNRNQGAESTLAFLATMAQVHDLHRADQATSSSASAASASSR
jgi:hypothetical protein